MTFTFALHKMWTKLCTYVSQIIPVQILWFLNIGQKNKLIKRIQTFYERHNIVFKNRIFAFRSK